MKQKETRISIVVDPAFLYEIKKRACLRNITIRKYVTRIIAEYMKKEDQYNT